MKWLKDNVLTVLGIITLFLIIGTLVISMISEEKRYSQYLVELEAHNTRVAEHTEQQLSKQSQIDELITNLNDERNKFKISDRPSKLQQLLDIEQQFEKYTQQDTKFDECVIAYQRIIDFMYASLKNEYISQILYYTETNVDGWNYNQLVSHRSTLYNLLGSATAENGTIINQQEYEEYSQSISQLIDKFTEQIHIIENNRR